LGSRPEFGFGGEVIHMAFVYILKDHKGKYYVGSSTDLERRIIQHKNGHTHSTHRMDKPILVFKQEYPTLAKAREIERRIKKLKRKDYIEKIIKDGSIKMI